MTGARRSRDEWREHISAWKRSGVQAVAYAEEHGLNPNTFAWWRSELGRETKPAPRLTLLPVTAKTAGTAPIEVVLPQHGVVVRVLDQADAARVAELVRALVRAC